MQVASSLLVAAATLVVTAVSVQMACPDACVAVIDPVCAFDGTYDNKCTFDLVKCQSGNALLAIFSSGECPSSSSSASAGSASSSGGYGGSNAGSACTQGFACPDVLDPVRGSDGVTYGNSCELKFAQCTDASITQVSTGKCASAGSSGSNGGNSDDSGGDDCSSETKAPQPSIC